MFLIEFFSSLQVHQVLGVEYAGTSYQTFHLIKREHCFIYLKNLKGKLAWRTFQLAEQG